MVEAARCGIQRGPANCDSRGWEHGQPKTEVARKTTSFSLVIGLRPLLVIGCEIRVIKQAQLKQAAFAALC